MNATFVNELPDSACSLFLHDSASKGPQAMWTLPPRGGSMELATQPGEVFTLIRAGLLAPLVRHTVSEGVSRYEVTEADAATASASCSADGADGDDGPAAVALACRVATSCTECTALAG